MVWNQYLDIKTRLLSKPNDLFAAVVVAVSELIKDCHRYSGK